MRGDRAAPLTILAAGASGRLRPVIDELLARGHRVRVTAREPSRQVATELAARGAQIVQADLEDRASLARAARGVDVIFGAGSPHQAGPDGESRHGVNIAEAVADSGVKHLIFASGAGADIRTGVPVFESKRAVEQRIRELGIPHTILAPVYFIDNALNPWNIDALAAGRFPLALPPDRRVQQLAIADLASVAAAVAERGPGGGDSRIELAGDEISGEEAAAALTRVAGRPFIFHQVALDSLPSGMRSLFEWLDRVGHHVDVDGLREQFPDVRWHRFEDWAGADERVRRLGNGVAASHGV
jgi:uncharacterized protein YbjT (DUF2867 family)